MWPEPVLPPRRSIRLKALDFAEPHRYAITPCEQRKRPIFGRTVGHGIVLTKIEEITDACWLEIRVHSPNVEWSACVMTPEHLHWIVILHQRTVGGGILGKDPRRHGMCCPYKSMFGKSRFPRWHRFRRSLELLSPG